VAARSLLPLPPVAAQFLTCLTEPRPEEAVVTIRQRQLAEEKGLANQTLR
jgi:hypothetical protein